MWKWFFSKKPKMSLSCCLVGRWTKSCDKSFINSKLWVTILLRDILSLFIAKRSDFHKQTRRVVLFNGSNHLLDIAHSIFGIWWTTILITNSGTHLKQNRSWHCDGAIIKQSKFTFIKYEIKMEKSFFFPILFVFFGCSTLPAIPSSSIEIYFV